MTIKFGRKHGNGYHGNTYQKITVNPMKNLKKYLVERTWKNGSTFRLEVFMFKLKSTDKVLKLIEDD